MTGYPSDEHVFSVVVIVLAGSPDCNLRSLVILCVPAALLHCVVSVLSVLHLLYILWTVNVSAVYSFHVCRILCAFRQLIFKQQLTSCAAAVKQAALSQVVSERRWKVPKESTRQVVTGVGTTSADEQNLKNERENRRQARVRDKSLEPAR